MDVLFGGDFDYGRGGLVLVSIGMGLYLSAATLNQALLAHGRAPPGRDGVWLACAVAFALFLLLPSFDDRVLQVEIAFVGAAALLCALLHILLPAGLRCLSGRERVADHPVPLQRTAGLGQRRLHLRRRGGPGRRRGGERLAAPAAAGRAAAARWCATASGVELRDGDTLVAEGRPAELLIEVPDPVPPDEARGGVGRGPGPLVRPPPLPHLLRLRPRP